MRTEAEKLLYEAIVELSYIHCNPMCNSHMCTTPVGEEIVDRAMKLLQVPDLSSEKLEDEEHGS